MKTALKRKVGLMLPVLLGILACKKESPTTNSSTTPPPAQKTYFPLTTGSSWQYVWDQNVFPHDYATDYYYVTGKTIPLDTAHPSNEIKEIYNNTKESYYYLKKYNDRYIKGDSMFGDIYQYIAFKDNVKAGDTWTDSVQDLAYASSWIYFTVKIKDVGLSMAIRGKTYNNVVHYESKCYPSHVGSPWGYDFDCYVAQEVGIIKKVDLSSTEGKYMELTSYTIK